MSNVEPKTRRYSHLAKALMLGAPVLLYLLAAVQSTDMHEALKPAAAPSVAEVAMASGLFMLRIGSIVLGILCLLVAFGGTPKETAPKWMVRD